jgi:starvation-inducible DNA-binding protein
VDFKLFTGTLKAYETESGDRFVSGTTSSTIRDLHGDAMAMSALKSMEETAKQNMTVFLNHNYNVPEDLFGSATDARIVKRIDEETGEEVYDLDIDVKVCPEDENPQAMQAYRAIKRGVKLGLSIGARVEHADKKRDDKSGVDTYIINKVRLLEASVVGIPANQRSYLHNAVKSLRSGGESLDIFEKSEHISKGDFVTWGSSGGAARGKVERIVTDGKVSIPDSDVTVSGTEDDPAALIRVWRPRGEGWAASDRVVGHKVSTLKKIAPLKESEKSFDDIEIKAVEVEGQQGADKAPLVGALYTLLSEATAFYLKAHGAHWNVVGEDFAQYHELFEEIYEDVHTSLDPIAESLRKLNSPAPAELKDLAGMVNDAPRAEDYEAESLAADLYAANEKLLENILVAFKVATDLNQQGIANFLAERQDMHQKWSWQLRASLAPEAEEKNEAEMEKSMTEEIVTQAAEETVEVAPEAEPAVAVEPVAEPVAEEAVADVEEYREVSEADVAEVLASATSNRLALETGAPVQGEVEASSEEPVAAEPVAEEVAVEAAPAEAAPNDAVIEEPGAEPASEDQGVEPVVEEQVDAEKSADVDEIGKIVLVAKSALDAAFKAQQEVESLRKENTELAAAKAKVEKDLESANSIIDRLSAEPVGRKLITKATEQRHSDATWLHPYIQRVLEAQD